MQHYIYATWAVAVALDFRGPRFKSSHQQKFIFNIHCQLYWIDENQEKEVGNGPLKNIYVTICLYDRLRVYLFVDHFLPKVPRQVSQAVIFLLILFP